MFRKSKWVSLLCAMMMGVLFFLAVTAVLLVSGVLSLNKTNLAFTTESVEALYDGVPLTNHNWRMSAGKLKNGHELEISFDSSQTNVGECKNALDVRIVDELGADVTSDYSIHYNFGTLKVNPRTLVITSASATKTYDGQPLVAESYEILTECDGLVRGHKATVVVTGYIIEPGKTSNTISSVNIYDESGNDVTANYQIVLREGLLVVEGQGSDLPGGSGEGPGGDSTGTGAPGGNTPGEDGPGEGTGTDTGDGTDPGVGSGDDFGPGGGVEPPDTDSTEEDTSEEEQPTEEETSDPESSEEEPTEEETTEEETGEQDPDQDDNEQDGGVDFDGNSSLLPNESNKDTVLFVVFSNTNDTVYLKMQSYGAYNGKGFEEAEAFDALLMQEYAASYLTSLALMQGGAQVSVLDIKSLCGIYVLPYYLDPHTGNYARPGNDLIYTGDTSDIYSAGYYNYSQNSLANHMGEILQYEQEYRTFVYGQYLEIDQESYDYMQALIAQQGFTKDDPSVIAKVASYIQNAAAYDLKYDPDLDTEENIVIAFLDQYKEGVCRHYAAAATLMFRALGIPARYTVGIVAQTQAGTWANVTAEKAHAWVEVYVDGVGWIMVEVTGSSSDDSGIPGGGTGSEQRPTVKLTPVTVRHQYDGTEFDIAKQQTVSLRGFEDYAELGYTLEAVVSGKRTEPGKTKSVIEDVRIFDADHNDVTDQFDLELNNGTIHVYLEKFDFSSASFEKVYDGLRPALSVTYDPALDQRFGVNIVSTAGYNVGKHTNTFKVTLTDANGKDVTDHYWINNVYGQVRITPLEITFKAGDSQKAYDGAPLTCDSYSLEEGALIEGHRIALCQIIGSQTEIGRSDNIITHIMIQDANGKDVTSNYSIKLVAGKLRVTRN